MCVCVCVGGGEGGTQHVLRQGCSDLTFIKIVFHNFQPPKSNGAES